MTDKDDRTPRTRVIGIAAAVVLVVITTAAAVASGQSLAAPDVVMLYLVSIMLVSVRWGYVPSLVAASLSVLAYDFFFVPPLYTFAVDDQRHLITFAVLFLVGLAISALTRRIRRQEHEAGERERRTAALYAWSRALDAAEGEPAMLAAARTHVETTFGSPALVLLAEGDRLVDPDARSRDAGDRRALRYAFEHARPAGRGVDRVGGAAVTAVRIGSERRGLGVLAVTMTTTPRPEAIALLDGFARQLGLALERSRAGEQADAAVLRARTEELRSALLSAVSHDLRTPLAVITGAATALRDAPGAMPADEREDLLATLCEEADRLERLVANLLDMTRVDAGALDVKRELVPLEEIVGGALARLEATLVDREISIDLGPDAPLVSADAVLLAQVFVNLLENAGKHTPPASPIDVRAHVVDATVVIEVADRGPGLPPGDPARLFEKWTRGPDARTQGAGLGLAICRGIVQAHGGAIEACAREDGGAIFRFRIAGEPSPALPSEIVSRAAPVPA